MLGIKDSFSSSKKSGTKRKTTNKILIEPNTKEPDLKKLKSGQEEQKQEKLQKNQDQEQQKENLKKEHSEQSLKRSKKKSKAEKSRRRKRSRKVHEISPTKGSKNLYHPKRRTFSDNNKGRHSTPYSFIGEFAENLHQRNYDKTITDLTLDLKSSLKGIVDQKSFNNYPLLVSKYRKHKIENEVLDEQVKLSKRVSKEEEEDILLLEKNIKMFQTLLKANPDNQDLQELLKQNELSLQQKQQNNPSKLLSASLIATKQHLDSKFIKENNLDAAHEMLQSISNLTYDSKIIYLSDEYKSERNIVGPALNKLKQDSQNCHDEFHVLNPAKIVQHMVDVIDIPRNIFLENNERNQPLLQMDERQRFFKFAALHLAICAQAFDVVKKALSDEALSSEFLGLFISQAAIKQGWADLLLQADDGSELSDFIRKQKEYNTELSKLTKKTDLSDRNKLTLQFNSNTNCNLRILSQNDDQKDPKTNLKEKDLIIIKDNNNNFRVLNHNNNQTIDLSSKPKLQNTVKEILKIFTKDKEYKNDELLEAEIEHLDALTSYLSCSQKISPKALKLEESNINKLRNELKSYLQLNENNLITGLKKEFRFASNLRLGKQKKLNFNNDKPSNTPRNRSEDSEERKDSSIVTTLNNEKQTSSSLNL